MHIEKKITLYTTPLQKCQTIKSLHIHFNLDILGKFELTHSLIWKC